MNTNRRSPVRFERPGPEFWFLAGPAFLSFAIASEHLLLTALIGASALLFRSLRFKSDSLAHAFANVVEWSALYGIYLYALLPLWPHSLSDYAWTPWGAIVLCSGLAASLPQRIGWGRPFVTFAAIGCLLLFRNLALFHDFHIPVVDLIDTASLVALIEIARSNRYSDSNDNKSIEFRLGLLLALFASFAFDSLWLAAMLCLASILGFLIGNHQRSKLPTGQAYSALSELEPLSLRRIPGTYAFLSIFALLLASLAFLLLLRAPFWADHVKDAPYVLRSLGQRATDLAQNAQLDTAHARELAENVLKTDWIERWNQDIREKSHRDPEPIDPLSPLLETDREEAEFSSNLPPPSLTARFEVPKIQSPLRRGESPPPSPADSASRPPPSTAPIRSVSDFYKSVGEKNLLSQVPEHDPSPASQYEPPSLATYGSPAAPAGPTDENPPPTSLQQRINETLDLNAYLERPAGAGNLEGLNLEPESIEALLDESPILTAKIDQASRRPQRLYLRLNYLDTVTEEALVSLRRSDERRIDSGNTLRLPQFQRNRDGDTTLTITAQGNRLRFLPLPESFDALTVFGANRISYFPDTGLIEPPPSAQPFTYQLTQVDLAFTAERRAATPLSPDALAEMKQLPLTRPDLQYLEELSTRIASERSSHRQFAQRAADYFQRHHPYSFSVDIPDGSGHPVVRWLKSEAPGVCSNYAAAFTLLARVRGIPSRVVGGYATREYDRRERHYVVRQRDAHAWVEYLDESNRWIRFDPTPLANGDEFARVQEYITEAEPESLERLVQSQREDLENPPSSREAETVADSAPKLKPEPATLAENRSPNNLGAETAVPPSFSPSQDALARHDDHRESEKTATASAPEAPAQSDPIRSLDREPPQTQSAPPSSEPATASNETTSDAAPNPLAPVERQNNQTSQSEPKPTKQPPTSNYWILLLVLIILCPFILSRLSKTVASVQQRPEPKLRAKAGRLLQSIDRFATRHTAFDLEDWRRIRAAATEQRYGPVVEPQRLRELRDALTRLSKKPRQSG